MVHNRRSAALAVFLVAGIASAVVASLAPAALAAPGGAGPARPAYYGHEVYKIYAVRGGPKNPVVTAKGAFRAKGSYYARSSTLAFPKGRIIIARHVTGTSMSGPSLSTCRFTIYQLGTFSVVRGTGKYRGLREDGTFRTTVHGKYNKTGPGRCGTRLVGYRSVTYQVGTVR